MVDHIVFAKEVATWPPQALKDAMRHDRAKLNEMIATTDPEALKQYKVIAHVLDESVLQKGQMKHMKRVFVLTHDSAEYKKVGWVPLRCAHHCMICHADFPHDLEGKVICYACGNVVCEKCGGDVAVVEELSSVEEVPVCVQCYFGQAVVPAARHEHLKFDGARRASIAPNTAAVRRSYTADLPDAAADDIGDNELRKRAVSDTAEFRSAGGNTNISHSLSTTEAAPKLNAIGAADPQKGTAVSGCAVNMSVLPRDSGSIANTPRVSDSTVGSGGEKLAGTTPPIGQVSKWVQREVEILPEAGFVIKTDNVIENTEFEKVFINVWQHSVREEVLWPEISHIEKPLVLFGSTSFAHDKAGNSTMVFNIAVSQVHFPFVNNYAPISAELNSKDFIAATEKANENRKRISDDVIIREILLLANRHFHMDFDTRNFVMPRVNAGFKGSPITEKMKFVYYVRELVSVMHLGDSNATSVLKAVSGGELAHSANLTCSPAVYAAGTDPRQALNEHLQGNVRSRLDSDTLSDRQSMISDMTMDYSVAGGGTPRGSFVTYGAGTAGLAPQRHTSLQEDVEAESGTGNSESLTKSIATPVASKRRHTLFQLPFSKAQNSEKSAASSESDGAALVDASPSGHKRHSIFGLPHNPFVHHEHNIASAQQQQQQHDHNEVTREMLEYKPDMSISETEAVALKVKSMSDPKVLIGWQILLADDATKKTAVYVITALKKNHLRKTEFKLSNAKIDSFVKLKRSDKKSGAVFKPLRKVMHHEELVGAPGVLRSPRASMVRASPVIKEETAAELAEAMSSPAKTSTSIHQTLEFSPANDETLEPKPMKLHGLGSNL